MAGTVPDVDVQPVYEDGVVVTDVGNMVELFWREKARGLVVGHAYGDALGAPFQGAAVVTQSQLDRDTTASSTLAPTANTSLMLAVAQFAVNHRDITRQDADALATALAHMWWTTRDTNGYGPDDIGQFQAHLRGDGIRRVGRPRAGVMPALLVSPLCLVSLNGSRLAAMARSCARVLTDDAVEITGAVVHAAAVGLALGSDTSRPLKPETVLRQLRETGGREFADLLDSVRQAMSTASPSSVARMFPVDEPSAAAAVPAALVAFLRHPDDADQCVRFAVRMGGQTSAIGALAGALVGARQGSRTLPSHYAATLAGHDRLITCADQLTAKLNIQLAAT
jgi:poly(ADP-ribose) glycohydrolase ARH3